MVFKSRFLRESNIVPMQMSLEIQKFCRKLKFGSKVDFGEKSWENFFWPPTIHVQHDIEDSLKFKFLTQIFLQKWLLLVELYLILKLIISRI